LLSKNIEVEFIGFKKLYPDFLYPGGSKVFNVATGCPRWNGMKKLYKYCYDYILQINILGEI